MNRRNFVALSTLLLPGQSWAGSTTVLPNQPESLVVFSGTRKIPATLVGLHSYTYPVSLVGYHGYQATKPRFEYKVRRSLNYDGVFWRDIHKSTGYNWAGLDTLVASCQLDKVDLLYCVMYTPEHLRWPGMENFPCPAPNWTGSTTMPNDLSQVYDFVVKLLQRYNSGTEMGIKYIEAWNEPAINGENYLTTMNVVPYWIGRTQEDTYAARQQRLNDLSLVHATIYQAVKDTDARVQVLNPGWSPGGSAEQVQDWQQYFNRVLPTGKTLKDCTDIFSCHPYTTGTQSQNILRVLNSYVQASQSVDAAKTLWGTEAGNEGAMLSSQDHVRVIVRKMLLAAALGYSNICLYAYEDQQYLGNPWQTDLTSQAIDLVSKTISNNTMTRCSILADNSVWASFQDRRTLNV